ncbi:hypothetical protein [Streptosporangium roseum]|uniref:hypothetical protein n=1 Tax=Streptosporangium roseum TaxID=2001 RepID=UPI0004CDAFAC|nr:hypothetical protein [Streptosporangium roseum]
MSTRQARRCSATRSRGRGPCNNYAMNGADVCHAHGGRAPQTRRRAAERLAEQKARTAMSSYSPDPAPVDNPIAELLQLAGEIKTFKDYLAGRVAEMRADDWRRTDDKGTEQLRAEVTLYERAMDRTARVLGDLVRLDLETRLVRLNERQGAMLAAVIRGSLDEHLARVLDLLGTRAEADAIRQSWPIWSSQIVPAQIATVVAGDRG